MSSSADTRVTSVAPRGPSDTRRLRLLLPYVTLSSFIQRDRAILDERFAVRLQPCRSPIAMLRTALAVFRAHCVLCWFGSLRFLPAVATAKLLGRRVIVVSGGYDVASVPELRYGNMSWWLTRLLGRSLLRMADAVACISDAAFHDALTNAKVPPERLHCIYLGFDDVAGLRDSDPRLKEDLVLTVAITNTSTLHRKGLLTVAQVSRLLPDVRFVLAGPADPRALVVLRAHAGPNLELRGYVSDTELAQLYRRAKVYLQPSLHEAFGVAVAEAMLYNCIPIVSPRGSLPEVAGDTGYYADPIDLATLAAHVRRALADGVEPSRSPRQHILRRFPLSARREQLVRLVESVCPRPVKAGV